MLMCWEKGVIRWLSTNSTILHLDSSSSNSRRHEIWLFISFYSLLLNLSPNKGRWREWFRMTRRLRLTKQRVRKVTGIRRLHGDHRAEQNVSTNRCTWVARDRRWLRGKQVFRFIIWKQLAYKTICIIGKWEFHVHISFFFFWSKLSALLCLELLHALKGVHLLWLLSMFPTWFC